MKKLTAITFAFALSFGAFAQQNDTIFIHTHSPPFIYEFATAEIDSIIFYRTQPRMTQPRDTAFDTIPVFDTIAHIDTIQIFDTIIINALQQKIDSLKIELGIANGTLVRDIDGNIYRTIKIGNQVWFAENLRVTRFNNGDTIRNIRDADVWNSYRQNMPPAFTYFNNDPELQKIFGNLYNWFVVGNTNNNQQNAGRNVCPVGWRVPSESDWLAMRSYLFANGYDHISVLKAIASSPELWNLPISTEMNTTGFSALPSGLRYYSGIFNRLGTFAFFYTSTPHTSNPSRIRSTSVELGRGWAFCEQVTYAGLSIRCIKD